jgi:hypothetical protein
MQESKIALRQEIRRYLKWFLWLIAIIIAFILARDGAAILELTEYRANSPSIFTASGTLNYARNARERNIELRFASGDTSITISCPSRAFKDRYRCPPATPAWTGSGFVVSWIDVPSGGHVPARRAVAIHRDGVELYKSSVTEVVETDISAHIFSILVSLSIFVPLGGFFYIFYRISSK